MYEIKVASSCLAAVLALSVCSTDGHAQGHAKRRSKARVTALSSESATSGASGPFACAARSASTRGATRCKATLGISPR